MTTCIKDSKWSASFPQSTLHWSVKCENALWKNSEQSRNPGLSTARLVKHVYIKLFNKTEEKQITGSHNYVKQSNQFKSITPKSPIPKRTAIVIIYIHCTRTHNRWAAATYICTLPKGFWMQSWISGCQASLGGNPMTKDKWTQISTFGAEETFRKLDNQDGSKVKLR